jgi:hypothetical protein
MVFSIIIHAHRTAQEDHIRLPDQLIGDLAKIQFVIDADGNQKVPFPAGKRY